MLGLFVVPTTVAPCAGPPGLAACGVSNLWEVAHAALMQENQRLVAANSTEPGTYLDFGNFLMAFKLAKEMLARRHAVLPADKKDTRPASLDLGCGGGFLVYVLRALGSDSRGVNPFDKTSRVAQLLPPTWRALGLTSSDPPAVRCTPVQTGLPLAPWRADGGGAGAVRGGKRACGAGGGGGGGKLRFDVVTALKMQFHTKLRDPTGKQRGLVRWSAREWDYFLQDLARHHLRREAVMLLEFINGFGAGYGNTPDVMELFTSLGARSKNRHTVIFDTPGWVEKARARPPVSGIENATQASSMFAPRCPWEQQHTNKPHGQQHGNGKRAR